MPKPQNGYSQLGTGNMLPQAAPDRGPPWVLIALTCTGIEFHLLSVFMLDWLHLPLQAQSVNSRPG